VRTRPANFVLTPGGFRHRSLVHKVEKGHGLHLSDKRVQFIELASKARKDVPKGEVRLGEVPDLGSGWISYAYWNNGTGNSITSFPHDLESPACPVERFRRNCQVKLLKSHNIFVSIS
jgi:hypothetical protein